MVNADDRLLSATKNGKIFCLDKNLKELWNYETNGTIYSSPLVEKDLVVVATNEGDLFTINANNGNLFQVIGIGETITSDIELVDIEFNGMQTKGISFGTAESNFYCYELYSLELIWWNQIAKSWINSSVSTADGKVIFQDKKGTLYCLNSQTGVLLWKWKPNTTDYDPLIKSDIIVKNNNIYFVDFDGDLHCIDALLGTKKWSIRNINATGLLKLNNKNELVIPSRKYKILIVSTKPGEVVNEIKLANEFKDDIVSNILIIGTEIVYSTISGRIYQIEPSKIPVRIFAMSAPIVSLNNINGNCLITDYDGNISMVELLKDKK
jgi:outer membrane protein assembly factor BamB